MRAEKRDGLPSFNINTTRTRKHLQIYGCADRAIVTGIWRWIVPPEIDFGLLRDQDIAAVLKTFGDFDDRIGALILVLDVRGELIFFAPEV